MIVVYSFHPMYVHKYTDKLDAVVGKLGRGMLEFTFLQAINILQGCYGVEN
jgi:hypothetical protein